MPAPSAIPPAAIMGRSISFLIACIRTNNPTSSGLLKPPPSVPSTTNPSTPQFAAFRAPSTLGTA